MRYYIFLLKVLEKILNLSIIFFMESIVKIITAYMSYLAHLMAIFVILTGMIKSMSLFIKDSIFHKESIEVIKRSRLELGNSFSLGLGFLIGASILKTTIAPNWDTIGKLSAIIAIRTTLNYFLNKELKSN